MSKRALILGCGYTGSRLALRLLQQGFSVTATNRTGTSELPIAVRPLDLLSTAPIDFSDVEGAVVYYTIGTLHTVYDAADRPHLLPLRRVFSALDRHSIAGFIYLSATSVYGDRQGDWVDENSSLLPDSPWGHMRVDLEQAVWDYGHRRRIPAAVLRLPEIYGPGRSPLDRLRRGYRLRFPNRFSNRIYIDDLVDVMVDLGNRLDRHLLLVADGVPATTTDVYQFAAQLTGLPSPEIGGDLPTDPNHLSLVRDSKRCRNTQLINWLGRPLRCPSYREGFTRLHELARQGQINADDGSLSGG